MFKQLTKAVFEAALKAEMNQHLGHERHGSRLPTPAATCVMASRPRPSPATFCAIQIAVPRDRDASFTPQLIPKHQRRLPGFDERILSL